MVNVLFFGTPQIAVPTLEWLHKNARVVGVVCRPDEPVGRGYKITAPPTKVFAEQNNIPVFQPSGPWTEETIASLRNLKAEVGIVVAYGRIMPESVFMTPRLGCVNIHFSMLPKYRGAAPMQWALINGETETGVSAFWLEAGLDSGPILHQQKVAIAPDDRVPELREKLVPAGIAVTELVIRDVAAGHIVGTPQKGGVTLAPLLKKELGEINWGWPASKIVNLVRGVCEWPGAATMVSSRKLKIWKAISSPHSGEGRVGPGTIVEVVKDRGFVVQAGEGRVLLLEVQPEGKKAMPAPAFWLGAHLKIGDKLG